MQDDYATDDNEVAYERLRPDLRQLIELAKQSLPVPYRPDGPQLAVDFDDPPLGDSQQADPDGPAKRKRVLVDGYEMEEDGEDGMNVSMVLACASSVTPSVKYAFCAHIPVLKLLSSACMPCLLEHHMYHACRQHPCFSIQSWSIMLSIMAEGSACLLSMMGDLIRQTACHVWLSDLCAVQESSFQSWPD